MPSLTAYAQSALIHFYTRYVCWCSFVFIACMCTFGLYTQTKCTCIFIYFRSFFFPKQDQSKSRYNASCSLFISGMKRMWSFFGVLCHLSFFFWQVHKMEPNAHEQQPCTLQWKLKQVTRNAHRMNRIYNKRNLHFKHLLQIQRIYLIFCVRCARVSISFLVCLFLSSSLFNFFFVAFSHLRSRLSRRRHRCLSRSFFRCHIDSLCFHTICGAYSRVFCVSPIFTSKRLSHKSISHTFEKLAPFFVTFWIDFKTFLNQWAKMLSIFLWSTLRCFCSSLIFNLISKNNASKNKILNKTLQMCKKNWHGNTYNLAYNIVATI